MTSQFAADVAATLDGDVSAEEVDEVLARARVRPAGALPVPHRLRLQELRFAGVKLLDGATSAEMDEGGEEAYEDDESGQPFDFLWRFDSGLYGIGSYENFRGKSSVLEVILWALRGRCGLQSDVRAWIREVRLTFSVDDELLTVEFQADDGVPHGRVVSGDVLLATFDGHGSFEALMDEVMMPRLGLTVIPAWSTARGGDGGQAVAHSWMAYAGALFITQRSLDYLLGDTNFSALPNRLLQMFVGTPWASTMVEAQVSAKGVRTELDAVRRRAAQDSDARATDRAHLEAELLSARGQLENLPDVTQSLRELSSAVEAVNVHSLAVARLQTLTTEARRARDAAAVAVRDEEARRLALLEDALARRFFNAFEPTVCPRCSSPVTPERQARERNEHECSVCSSGLDLDSLAEDLVLAADVPAEEKAVARAGAQLVAATQSDEEAQPPADDLVALGEALAEAEQHLADLVSDLTDEQGVLEEANARVAGARSVDAVLASRRRVELEIARLEGALQQLGRAEGRTEESAEQQLARRERILHAAEDVARRRVHEAQGQLLSRVSTEILTLGQQFGIEALQGVTLRGNATLQIQKGGRSTSYRHCTRGEQLRLKVATAVALLRVGFTDGVGRHPGLLLVDSPGAEEAASENIDAMLNALKQVAADVPYLQVIVATRSPESLEGLLSEDRRRIAPPGGYVW